MPAARSRRSLMMIAAALCLAASAVQADLIKLKSGGELRGEIPQGSSSDDQTITIETLNGVRVSVAREDIEFVSRRPRLIEVYETRIRDLPDTVDAHMEMAEWCRENLLIERRNDHLERVIQLEPQHDEARRALGHIQKNGVWMSRDEERLAMGYVKYRGRYITPQELELIEKTEAELAEEQQWYRKVRLWRGWLTGRNFDRQQQALQELKAISDPNATPALTRNFSDDENKELRELYVDILAQLPGLKPVKPLVNQSLRDVDHQIRSRALNGISEQQYAAAAEFYAQALRDDLNVVVRRAANALGKVGDERIIGDLIDALVTTHSYKLRVPDTSGTLSFGTNGSFGTGATPLPPEIELGLRMGQYPNGVIIHDPLRNQTQRMKTINIQYDHQNAEALASLQKLTGKNFGFDERNWRLWLNAQQSITPKP